MSLFQKIMLIVLFAQISNNSFSKSFTRHSPAGRSFTVLEDFWVSKFSPNLKEGCVASDKCDELAQFMTAVIVLAQRPSKEVTEKAIAAIKNGTASVDDIVMAEKVTRVYGEAVVSNDTLSLPSNEPTSDGRLYVFDSYSPALKRIQYAVEAIGRKQEWTPEQVAQESKKLTATLLEVINSKKD